ncbi:hypothetical protein [Muriicola soli]|uniref:Lipoprotein n=1 Tax=Muriicola soli TaxID=2507538 RepID=A0A411E612_9FLAO|nr:hypothetical protein [Muriicola soli]QBA63145.1 hypothetical protein EQY75_00365 [Muriicola soli]
MRKIMSILSLFLVIQACQESGKAEESAKEEIQFFSLDSMPKRTALNSKAAIIVRDWIEFKELETGFDALSTVDNEEDLILVLEDLVEKQKRLEEGLYPPEFDVPQVKSRQKVLKTFIFKTRAAAQYRIDATAPAIEMHNAYNALRAQLNVIVNNTLDTELIIDE